MGLKTHNMLITLGSLVVGGGLGEWWRLDARLEALGRAIEAKITGATPATPEPASGQRSIARAFVMASLIFCVGPVTVLGAISDGAGDYQLLAIKVLWDGITAIALASSLGWGVGLAAVTVLGFQGGITAVSTLVGHQIAPWLNVQVVQVGQAPAPLGQTMLDELTAVGGLVIVGLGLLLLEIKQLRIANFVPALALAPLIVLALHWLGLPIAP